MPTALQPHLARELLGDLTHPSSRKAGGILVPRAGHCPVHSPLANTRYASPHQYNLICVQNGSMKPFPACQCSRVWILCAEILQGSLLIACIDSRGICLQSPGRWGELEPAVGLPWLTAAKPAASSQDQSAVKSQLGDLLRARREGGGGQGKVRAVAHQPQSTAQEQPGHQAALPATRTDPAPGKPTYRAADLWGGGGPCVCSQQINPGTLLIHRQGSKKLSKAEHRSETIFLNRLFILSFKSMLSGEKAELQKHLICVFQRCHIT